MTKRHIYMAGVTLLEIMFAAAIFSFLAGLMFYIFSISARSWIKVRQTVEIKENSQILMARIENELRATSVSSLDIIDYPSVSDPNQKSNAISFLSPYDDNGNIPEYDSYAGAMKWKKYIIFYLDDDTTVKPEGYYQLFMRKIFLGDNFSTLLLKKLPYPPLSSTPLSNTNPMKNYIDGTVPSDIYLTAPRPVTGNIRKLNFTANSNGKKVDIIVKFAKPVNPMDVTSPEGPDKLELRSTVVLRNL